MWYYYDKWLPPTYNILTNFFLYVPINQLVEAWEGHTPWIVVSWDVEEAEGHARTQHQTTDGPKGEEQWQLTTIDPAAEGRRKH